MNQAHYFIAIPLPMNFKKELLKTQKLLRKDVSYKSWTHLEDFHITLKFLGPVTDNTLKALAETLSIAIAQKNEFEVKPSRLGTFGNVKQPRVLWFGVEYNESIKNLFDLVDNITNQYKFARENKTFTPHITLAKKWLEKDKIISRTILEEEDNVETNEFKVDHIMICRIFPNSTPKYKAVYVFNLKGCTYGSIN